MRVAWPVALAPCLALAGAQATVRGSYVPGAWGDLIGSAPAVHVPPHARATAVRRAAKAGDSGLGTFVDLGVDAGSAGRWERAHDGGWVWRVALRSRGATAMGLVFDRLEMPPGAELYVHGAGETRGAYTQAVNGKPDGTFSTWPLDGDALVLEYWEPADATLAHVDSAGRRYMSGFKAGVPERDLAVMDGLELAPSAQGRPTLGPEDVGNPAVLHGADPGRSVKTPTHGPVGVLVVGGVTAEYGKQRFGYGASQDCHHDVACVSELPERVQGALKAAKHAVVLLRSARGAHYCTGTLVNAADESKVYVLTAAHCVPPAGARGMSEWLVALHYRHTRCDNKEPRANDVAEFPVEAEYAEEPSDSSATSDDDAGVYGQLNDWNDGYGLKEADQTLLSAITQTATKHIGMHKKHETEQCSADLNMAVMPDYSAGGTPIFIAKSKAGNSAISESGFDAPESDVSRKRQHKRIADYKSTPVQCSKRQDHRDCAHAGREMESGCGFKSQRSEQSSTEKSDSRTAESTCGRGSALSKNAVLLSGLRYVAYREGYELALMELLEPIPAGVPVYLAGFSAKRDALGRDGAKGPPRRVFTVHHPAGDAQKVAWHAGRLAHGHAHPVAEMRQRGYWMVPEWDAGTTEPGSSGAGLFDGRGRVLAALQGGLCSCVHRRGYDFFGALSSAWDKPGQRGSGAFLYGSDRARGHFPALRDAALHLCDALTAGQCEEVRSRKGRWLW